MKIISFLHLTTLTLFIIAIFVISSSRGRLSTTIPGWPAATRHITTIIEMFTTAITLCFTHIVNGVTTVIIIAIKGFIVITSFI